MPKDDVDQQRVRVSSIPPPSSSIKRVDDVFIIVTQAFCSYGHNLVTEENEMFDGFPGIRLMAEGDGKTSEVTLSPIHGDGSKRGGADWPAGQRLKVSCPVCQTELPRLASCRCEGEGDLIKIFLTPGLKDSHILALCNVWGCRRSHTIDNWEIISEYLDGQIAD